MKPLIVIALFVGMYSYVSSLDYDDARTAEQKYCSDVKQGYYPDYKMTYQKYCKK